MMDKVSKRYIAKMDKSKLYPPKAIQAINKGLPKELLNQGFLVRVNIMGKTWFEYIDKKTGDYVRVGLHVADLKDYYSIRISLSGMNRKLIKLYNKTCDIIHLPEHKLEMKA